MGKAYVKDWAGPEPLPVGGIWISRGETFAKSLGCQRMVHVPGRRETGTSVLTEAGGLVRVPGI